MKRLLRNFCNYWTETTLKAVLFYTFLASVFFVGLGFALGVAALMILGFVCAFFCVAASAQAVAENKREFLKTIEAMDRENKISRRQKMGEEVDELVEAERERKAAEEELMKLMTMKRRQRKCYKKEKRKLRFKTFSESEQEWIHRQETIFRVGYITRVVFCIILLAAIWSFM